MTAALDDLAAAQPAASGRYRCAAASSDHDEALVGTASTVCRWLLIEQPGAWGVDAPRQSDLDPVIGAELEARARAAGARLLLIRRTGGGLASAGRRVYVASTTAGDSWLERLTVRDPRDLLDLDLGPLADGETVGGRRLHEPLYLVCTNGKHDPCCAEFGLPLARALAPQLDERVWECSHVGGDRFAGNLVCLPEAVYHGRVSPADAAEVVAAHDTGHIALDTYRGRSIHPFVVQAADALTRRELTLTGLGALVWVGHDEAGEGRTRVRFTTPVGHELVVTVAATRARARQLTCHAARLSSAPHYELVDLSTTT